MTTRDYILTFEDRGPYLYAFLTGKRSFATGLRYWNEIADRAIGLGCSKILVHESMTGDVSEEETAELILDVLPTAKGIQLALFDENPKYAVINEFGRRFADAHGINVRVFQSLEAAEAWLLGG